MACVGRAGSSWVPWYTAELTGVAELYRVALPPLGPLTCIGSFRSSAVLAFEDRSPSVQGNTVPQCLGTTKRLSCGSTQLQGCATRKYRWEMEHNGNILPPPHVHQMQDSILTKEDLKWDRINSVTSEQVWKTWTLVGRRRSQCPIFNIEVVQRQERVVKNSKGKLADYL
jgi:hypothetical protein